MTRVLLIGFTAEAAHSPLSVEDLDRVITAGFADVADAGYEVVNGWIGVDHDSSVAEVRRLLSSTNFDVVMIGNGIRGPAECTELFEQLVNVVHELAPQARFAFNADPASSLIAVRRNTLPGSGSDIETKAAAPPK